MFTHRLPPGGGGGLSGQNPVRSVTDFTDCLPPPGAGVWQGLSNGLAPTSETRATAAGCCWLADAAVTIGQVGRGGNKCRRPRKMKDRRCGEDRGVSCGGVSDGRWGTTVGGLRASQHASPDDQGHPQHPGCHQGWFWRGGAGLQERVRQREHKRRRGKEMK